MTYRDGDEAQERREKALARVRRELDRAAAEAKALEARHEALTQALRDAEHAIGARRAKVPLPLLERVQIASPCHARWDEMSGDERVRHCGACDKDVYDLSEMTAADAEALLTREGDAPCVRLHRRADGTVITSDCPVGAKKKRRRRWLAAGAAVAGGLMAAAGFTAASATTQGEPCMMPPGEAMMGAVAVMPPPVVPPTHTNVSPDPQPVMGGPMIPPPAPEPMTPAHDPGPRMGRIALHH